MARNQVRLSIVITKAKSESKGRKSLSPKELLTAPVGSGKFPRISAISFGAVSKLSSFVNNRRCKNTALCGAGQARTTISCITLGFRCTILGNSRF
jgi:hypothetical protein